MHVLIRADASRAIGTGHVMRCLVLADHLSRNGANCLFVCSRAEGDLAKLIEARGHHCKLLDTSAHSSRNAGYDTNPPSHAGWLTSSWQQDAKATIDVTEELRHVELAIVDHYALDHRWEERLAPHIEHLIVIDDLADRPHCADFLVDQNYGRGKQHYSALVPERCEVLAGAQFAIVQPQFAAIRKRVLAHRKRVSSRKQLLIFLGGGATDKFLDGVTNALCSAQPERLRGVTLVTGGARNGVSVSDTLRSRLGVPVETFEHIENMAEPMSRADLSVGGGGHSNWERCTLGLPSLVIELNENQRTASRLLARDGHIFACVDAPDLDDDLMRSFVDMSDSTYQAISHNAATVTDGIGVQRVMEALGIDAC